MACQRVPIGVHELDRQQQHQRAEQDLPDSRDRRSRRPGQQLHFRLGLLLRLCSASRARTLPRRLRYRTARHRRLRPRRRAESSSTSMTSSLFSGVLDVVDLDPFLDGFLADPRLAARAVGHSIAAADFDVPAFERDVFLRGGLFDLDVPAAVPGRAVAPRSATHGPTATSAASFSSIRRSSASNCVWQRPQRTCPSATRRISVVTRNVVWQFGH